MEYWTVCEVCKKKRAEFVVRLEEYYPDMDSFKRCYDAVLLCSDCAKNNRFKIEDHDYGFCVCHEIRYEKRIENENI